MLFREKMLPAKPCCNPKPCCQQVPTIVPYDPCNKCCQVSGMYPVPYNNCQIPTFPCPTPVPTPAPTPCPDVSFIQMRLYQNLFKVKHRDCFHFMFKTMEPNANTQYRGYCF